MDIPPPLPLSSDFELPWFDLDVREAKETVRTTRSKARAALQSAESAGVCGGALLFLRIEHSGNKRAFVT